MALIHNIVGPPTAERVLLLVHGYGADERDLGGVLPYLDPHGHFLTVLPRGPVAAPPGFAWFDLDSVQPGHVTDATFTSGALAAFAGLPAPWPSPPAGEEPVPDPIGDGRRPDEGEAA